MHIQLDPAMLRRLQGDTTFADQVSMLSAYLIRRNPALDRQKANALALAAVSAAVLGAKEPQEPQASEVVHVD